MSYEFARFLNIRGSISPVLSPDGSRVAYLSDVTGNWQVWSVGTRGEGDARWPRQLTFLQDKVWELYGTGAAQHLIAVSDVAGNERQQFYLVSNFGVDLDGSEAHDVRRLTTDDDAIHRFGAWHRNGYEIMYTSNARNGVHFDLYRMDLRTGAVQLVHKSDGMRLVVAWSPDGRFVLSVDEVASLEFDLYLLDLESGEERTLTADQPPARYWAIHWSSTGIYLFTDRTHDRGAFCRLDPETGLLTEIFQVDADSEQGELELLAIASDGRTAAYTINVDGYSQLFLFDTVIGNRHRVDDLPPGVINSLLFNARSTFAVVDLQSATTLPDVWSVRVVDGTCRQLTFSNRAGVDPRSFVAPEQVKFTSFDGLQVPAYLFRPQQPAPAAGYPCVIYVHGGPAHQVRPEFFVSFQYFVSQGYAVFAPNVRGSTGYGRAYTAMDDVELRKNSVADLKAAVAWLHERPEIDPSRVAIYGRSYGGFMVLAAMTEYPELFAAGIDIVGISNWVTFMQRTGAWRRAHREREYGSLTDHRDLLEQLSPIHKVERIKAPLLVLAGDNDPRVPLYESEQLVERVTANGGVVEFVHYADEGHIFSRLENRIDSFTKIANFLRRYV